MAEESYICRVRNAGISVLVIGIMFIVIGVILSVLVCVGIIGAATAKVADEAVANDNKTFNFFIIYIK